MLGKTKVFESRSCLQPKPESERMWKTAAAISSSRPSNVDAVIF